MVLVDTSVWILHFREGSGELKELLNAGEVACHPFIIGELACGNLHKRPEILSLLRALPAVIEADHSEVMNFIEAKRLMGRGLGYIDIHLLASAVLIRTPIWSLDRKLDRTAAELGIRAGKKLPG